MLQPAEKWKKNHQRATKVSEKPYGFEVEIELLIVAQGKMQFRCLPFPALWKN